MPTSSVAPGTPTGFQVPGANQSSGDGEGIAALVGGVFGVVWEIASAAPRKITIPIAFPNHEVITRLKKLCKDLIKILLFIAVLIVNHPS
jgi:hypothetical protein